MGPLGVASLLGILLLPTAATAHIAPALNDNNRYLKVSILGDRIRLAYTVFMGEVPGAQTRPRLDKNRDGLIDDQEARQFGDEMAALIQPGLRATIDGDEIVVAFTEVHVGMGTPTVAAGAFSVDLVTHLCLGAGPSHEVSIFDTSRLPLPGETEIKIEPAPGIKLDRATLGADGRQSQLEFKWIGAESPISTAGLFLNFSTPAQMGATPSDCGKISSPAQDSGKRTGSARRIITLLGVAVIASTAVAIARRRRKQTR